MVIENIQAVLFDLDGTLIDSAPDLAGAANAMRMVRGMDVLPLAQYRSMAGAGARGMLHVAFGIQPENPDFDDLREEFFQQYERCMTLNTVMFAGVKEVVNAIEKCGLKWGVVTNKAARFTLPLTRSMPLFEKASVIVSGDTTAFSKPHPEPLFEAARQLGVSAQHCVYVGDDERDIQAGQAAGMATIAVTYGYLGAQPDTARWQATATINCINELLPLLQLGDKA